MQRKGRTITTWTAIGLLACATVSAGCEPTNWLGNNLNVNVVVPLGLGGTPGLLNPFGLLQAWVNALLGGAPADTADEADEAAPLDGASPPTELDPTLGVVLN